MADLDGARRAPDDAEVAAQPLPQEPVDSDEGPRPGDPAASPTVVCDNLHVVYKVVVSTGSGSATGALRRLLKRQGGGQVMRTVHAVQGVSFVAREGDAIGLIGRNGSGKSTLLRAVAGLLPAERGAVYTSGRPSLLGVNAALMRDLSGEQNILIGCMAMGMTRAEARAKRDWIAQFADIGDFIQLPMSAYSSGMAARLRFAIAASVSHEILMIDEALATGDAEFRLRSERRIMELREEAGTVFLVSHSLGTVRETCNRAIWLERGQMLMDGEANEVVDAYEAVYDPDADRAARLKERRRKRRERREAAIARDAAAAALAAVAAAQNTETAELKAIVADRIDINNPLEASAGSGQATPQASTAPDATSTNTPHPPASEPAQAPQQVEPPQQ